MTKNKHVPLRTCVGCREIKPKSSLIRIVDSTEGLKLDPQGKMNGRGVYICPDEKCLEEAWKRNGIKRSLKKNIDKTEMETLYEELSLYEQEST